MWLKVKNSKIVYLLDSWIEGFNDCACCPLSMECDQEQTDCVNNLKKWLTTEEEQCIIKIQTKKGSKKYGNDIKE